MTEIELPHEEDTKRYCPRLCPYANTFGDTPCILKEDLTEPMIVEGRNFNCDMDCEHTVNDIKEHVKQFLNPLQEVISVVKQPGFFQVYFKHNLCPLWAIREIYGDTWTEWFTGEISVEDGVAKYPIKDALGDAQVEVEKKLKEKKAKDN